VTVISSGSPRFVTSQITTRATFRITKKALSPDRAFFRQVDDLISASQRVAVSRFATHFPYLPKFDGAWPLVRLAAMNQNFGILRGAFAGTFPASPFAFT
jgi:hypothetical protein